MVTFNEDLLEAMIGHQIGIQQFSGGIRNRIWALLDATEADMSRRIRNARNIGLDSPRRVKNLNTLLGKLKEIRHVAFTGAREVWFSEMRAFARAEPGFFDNIFQSVFSGVELGTTLPSVQALNNIVTSQPFMGRTLSGWASNIESVDIARIEDQIRIGLVQGESPNQLSKRIVGTVARRGKDGVTQITRRNAASITRTVVNGIGAESRRQFADANKDLAPDEVFTATLDARTTNICKKFDGKKFKVGEGPTLPLHFGERSLYVPVVDGEHIGTRPRRDFTQAQLVREYARANNLSIRGPRGQTVRAGRAAIPRGHKARFDKFARERMRQRTGSTPARTTYSQWLGRRSAAIQDDILGPTRGALFRRGGLSLDKFVDTQGRTITLAQLARRNPSVFVSAGLKPGDF